VPDASDNPGRRADDRAALDPTQRVLCHALRDGARIVAAAGLPADYRAAAYAAVIPRVLDRAAMQAAVRGAADRGVT
jgi:hypothetical protein